MRRHRFLKLALAGGTASTLGTLAIVGFFLIVVASLVGSNGSFTQVSAAPLPNLVVAKYGNALPLQEEFAGALSQCDYLDPTVNLAWTLAEGGGVNPGQPAFNFLFLTAVGGGFRSFASPEDAASAVCLTLGGSDYAGIRAAAGGPPVFQILAIAASPWDGGHVAWGDPAGHYGGRGENLTAAYYRLFGTVSCPHSGTPC